MPLPPALAARLKKRGILTAAREAQGTCILKLESNRTLLLKKIMEENQKSTKTSILFIIIYTILIVYEMYSYIRFVCLVNFFV